MRILLNPHRELEARYPPGQGAARDFHASLPGYAPTPLRELRGLARELGVARLFVKDESRRFGLPAFKVLGASFAVATEIEARSPRTSLGELAEAAKARGLTRLVTATDGNHGRGVARVARWLGLDASVFMPASTVPARSMAIASEGADVQVLEGVYDDAVREAARAATEPGALLVQDTAWEGYEAIPARIVAGYATILEEIDEQLGREREDLDLVLMPVGVGSLADAMVRHFRSELRTRVPRLAAVEPEGAACLLAALERGVITSVPRTRPTMMAGLDCGTLSSISWPTLRASVDVAIALDDEPVARAMRALARKDIVSGESGAACVGALLACAHDSSARAALGLTPASRVLVISTEGATDPENYARIVAGAQ